MLFLLLALLSPTPTGAAPATLDKGAERWLRQVHLLILPDEEVLFRSLLGSEDRKEFQRIFWARRGALQQGVAKTQARADDLFTLPGTPGSETGCGQVFALLGDPVDVEGGAPGQLQGRGAREQFDSLQAMREGSRRPETWVYRSRPGDVPGFTGGELRILFDEACRFSEAGRIQGDLRQAAERRVVRRDLAYRVGPDGHLVRLEELQRTLGTGGGHEARALLESERKDFPLEAELKLVLRTQAGQVYAAGLLRAPGTGPVEGTVAARAQADSGAPSAVDERAFAATSGPEGTFPASFGLSLAPGRYVVRLAMRLADGRGSVATLPVQVPDFNTAGLKATALVLYPDEVPPPADPRDPYAALSVGPLRIRPRFGNVFAASDALQVVSVLYGGKADAAGKASLRARFTVLKDGATVAKGDDQRLDTPMAVASVGPLSLTGLAPGRYVVRLEAADEASGSTASQDLSFEVK